MKRKEKAAETEAALKAAAQRLFATRGYLNTKITDITAEAGRAAGSFYNHFASKEELLESLLADLEAAGDETVDHPEHSPDFTDPAAVRFHVAGYWHFYAEHAATLRALRQAAQVNEDFARKLNEFTRVQNEEITDHVDYVTEAGHRLPGSPLASVTLMTAVVDSFAQLWHDGVTDLTEDEAIEALTRFVYRGISGRDY
ncbi:TetR/AcrR family transcriptional regulator [Amycolatopsis thermalba]|uniref:TetR/AcrR family transcriptional regulator n=1 Tax=Amycolatopsis thermalba TaxID=944492 RepID=A0ABY4NRF6_9PSEU|nr:MULTISPECIES: TetR/AcrR family transcriptional regulator [Amycolatopsis]UQS22639.1 TetR/AcrR family transcriptional regulator [Amycolatopsis thermalba]